MEHVDCRPYRQEQLEAIVRARLKAAAQGVEDEATVMEPDTIKLALPPSLSSLLIWFSF